MESGLLVILLGNSLEGNGLDLNYLSQGRTGVPRTILIIKIVAEYSCAGQLNISAPHTGQIYQSGDFIKKN